MHILAFLGAVGVLALSMILRGWVLTCLWDWFMVPLLGVPILPVVYAIGIALTIRYLTHSSDHLDSKFKISNTSQVLTEVLSPIVVLLFGWIVQMFI